MINAFERFYVKVCSSCKKEKSYSEFYKFSRSVDGYSTRCKSCNYVSGRISRLKCKFKISLEDFNLLLKNQQYCCKLCERKENDVIYSTVIKGPKQFAVDHDHSTGVIRGLLCSQCNQGLGNFKDSSNLLRKAADYIDSFKKDL